MKFPIRLNRDQVVQIEDRVKPLLAYLKKDDKDYLMKKATFEMMLDCAERYEIDEVDFLIFDLAYLMLTGQELRIRGGAAARRKAKAKEPKLRRGTGSY